MKKNRAEEGLSSLEALVQQGVNNALKDLHTAMPGIIDTFDPATQTCTVQPTIKRIFVDGEAVALPVLINVPVHISVEVPFRLNTILQTAFLIICQSYPTGQLISISQSPDFPKDPSFCELPNMSIKAWLILPILRSP